MKASYRNLGPDASRPDTNPEHSQIAATPPPFGRAPQRATPHSVPVPALRARAPPPHHRNIFETVTVSPPAHGATRARATAFNTHDRIPTGGGTANRILLATPDGANVTTTCALTGPEPQLRAARAAPPSARASDARSGPELPAEPSAFPLLVTRPAFAMPTDLPPSTDRSPQKTTGIVEGAAGLAAGTGAGALGTATAAVGRAARLAL